MNYTNLFKIALRAIMANKMRSFLTALGIIIGVASVITMLAIASLTVCPPSYADDWETSDYRYMTTIKDL